MKMKIKLIYTGLILSIISLIALGVNRWLSLLHVNRYLMIALFTMMLVLMSAMIYFIYKHVYARSKMTDAALSKTVQTKQVKKLLKQSVKKVIQKIHKKVFFLWKKQKELYYLPWFLVLGLEKAGKRDLLNALNPIDLSSELNLHEMISESQYGCRWYMTNRAMCLDVSEKLLAQDPDNLTVDTQLLWHYLLNLINRFRHKKPINGILLMINVANFQTLTEDEIKHYGQLIYQRLHEVYTAFNRILPVHIILTESDSLRGYEEFYSDSVFEEHKDTLGFVIPTVIGNQLHTAFFEYYDQLIENIYSLIYTRLHRESTVKNASSIFVYPLQIIYLKKKLKILFSQLFRSNHHEAHILVKTFYLAMATLNKHTFDFVSHDIADRFGLSISPRQPRKEQEMSIFVMHDFFRQTIISASNLELLTERYQQKYQTIKLLSYGAIMVLFVVLAVGIGNSYIKNRDKLNAFNTMLTSYQQQVIDTKGKILLIDRMVTQLELLEKMSLLYYPKTDSLQLHWGLYPGSTLHNQARVLYEKYLIQIFLPELIRKAHTQLQTDQQNNLSTFENLTVYLMLGDPNRIESSFVKNWFSSHWYTLYSSSNTIVPQLNHQLDNLLLLPLPNTALDTTLIARIRNQLQQFTSADYLYSYIKHYEEKKHKKQLYLSPRSNFDFGQLFGPKAYSVFVDSFYSAQGYQWFTQSKKEFNQFIQLVGWVLDDDTMETISLEALDAQLDKLYFTDYTIAWQNALQQLNIVPFENLHATTMKLGLLADPNSSPLVDVLSLIRNNSNVKSLQKANINSDFTTYFSGLNDLITPISPKTSTPLSVIMGQLKQLTGLVQSINSAENPQTAAFAFAETFIQTGKNTLFTTLLDEATQVPLPMQRWLNQIVGYTWQAMLNMALTYINTQWNHQVWPYYSTTMRDKYPFVKKGAQLAMADFNHFFCSNGLYINFWQTYLAPFITVNLNQLSTTVQLNQGLSVSVADLNQFRHALIIHNAFCQNTETARIQFMVSPVSLSSNNAYSQLDLYDHSFTYRHGPITTNTLTWPSTSNFQLASLRMEGLNGETKTITVSGPWALFMLLDHATRSFYNKDTGAWVFYFNFGQQAVAYSFKSNTLINPFDPQFFANFHLNKQSNKKELIQ